MGRVSKRKWIESDEEKSCQQGTKKQEQTSFLGWVLQMVIASLERGGSAMMGLAAQNSRDLVELTGGKTGEGYFLPDRASCCNWFTYVGCGQVGGTGADTARS